MPVQKICVVCGKSFLVPPNRAETASACSNACAITVRAKSRERKVSFTCAGCGIKLEIPQSHRDRRVYCSKDCMQHSKVSRKNMSDRVSGDKNPMWKGGETMHSDGYIYALSPQHPYLSLGNYVFKHRLVMEEMLKARCPGSKYLIRHGNNLYLSPDYVVHHIDFDRVRNVPDNLIVCSNKSHTGYHNGRTLKKNEYWPNDKVTEEKLLEMAEQITKTS